MPDFTGGGIHALPTLPGSTGNPALDVKVRELVAASGCRENCGLIEELVITALKMGRDRLSVADLKLFNRALKELRYAARVFAPYVDKRKVVVFGSARTPETDGPFRAAEEFGAKMGREGFMVITGGGEGIMGAAQRGAGREMSFGLNIRLPFEQRPNPVIQGDAKLINFNYFFTRKLNFLKETHAVALFPGGFGTMDEGFEVLTLMQTGKARILPVVLVDQPRGNYWKTFVSFLRDHLLHYGLVSESDFDLFSLAGSVDDAVAEILRFYQNFHSYRWVGKLLVIRMLKALAPEAIARLNVEFADILTGGSIEQKEALPEERNEPETTSLPRLILAHNQRDFGRLRRLIDAINAAETVPST